MGFITTKGGEFLQFNDRPDEAPLAGIVGAHGLVLLHLGQDGLAVLPGQFSVDVGHFLIGTLQPFSVTATGIVYQVLSIWRQARTLAARCGHDDRGGTGNGAVAIHRYLQTLGPDLIVERERIGDEAPNAVQFDDNIAFSGVALNSRCELHAAEVHADNTCHLQGNGVTSFVGRQELLGYADGLAHGTKVRAHPLGVGKSYFPPRSNCPTLSRVKPNSSARSPWISRALRSHEA